MLPVSLQADGLRDVITTVNPNATVISRPVKPLG